MKLKKYISMNEAVEVSDIDYSTIDHVMAGAYRESEELRQKAEKAMEDRKLEMPNEDINAHKDIKTADMKKMHLSESFFTEWFDDDDDEYEDDEYEETEPNYVVSDNGGGYIFIYDENDEQFESGVDFETFSDLISNEEFKLLVADDIDWNKKLAILKRAAEETADAYSNPEFEGIDFDYVPEDVLKDWVNQCVAYLKDNFTLDESLQIKKIMSEAAYTDDHIAYIEESYKTVCRYYNNVEAAVNAFRSEADLMDASEVLDDIAVTLREKIESVNEEKEEIKEAEAKPLNEYKRQEGSKLVYKQKRDSLAEIILVELTEGEWGYVENPDGSTSPTRLPSANYLDDKIGVVFGRDDSCSIRIWAKDEEALQPAVDIAKKYGKDYKVGSDKYVKSEDKFYCDIFLTEEDWEGHYFDPNVPVAKAEKSSKKKVEELEEDIKEEQAEIGVKEECIHPSEEIEESIEDVEREVLTEARISTEGLRNFRPWDGAINTYQKIVESNKLDTLEFMLEDMYPNGVGANELNDMLQFESDWILESLGLIEKTDSEDDDIYETVVGPDGNPMKKLKETI